MVFIMLKVFIQSFQSFLKVFVILHKAIDFKGVLRSFKGLSKVKNRGKFF